MKQHNAHRRFSQGQFDQRANARIKRHQELQRLAQKERAEKFRKEVDEAKAQTKENLKVLAKTEFIGAHGQGKNECVIKSSIKTFKDGGLYIDTDNGSFKAPEILQKLKPYEREIAIRAILGSVNDMLRQFGKAKLEAQAPLQKQMVHLQEAAADAVKELEQEAQEPSEPSNQSSPKAG